jgi:hypothetical protein
MRDGEGITHAIISKPNRLRREIADAGLAICISEMLISVPIIADRHGQEEVSMTGVSTRAFSPQDVIIGLLAFQKEGEERFRADPVRIHKAVAKLKSDERFSELFKGLVFDRRDYFPYSEYLEETLDALQLGGNLDRANPRGVYYQTRRSLRTMFEEEIRQRFREDELKRLEEASSEFFAIVGT